MSQYCTYLTVYKGNKMPPFYIGSTSVERVHGGYKGTVLSAAYKEVWNEELKHRDELFETKIVSVHDSRKDALDKENKLHIQLGVKDNNLYINKAVASGCFGNMDEASIEKMRKTKKAQGKIVGAKVSARRNDPQWKETVGKEAALKLSKTKRDPSRAHMEAERNRKNSETVNSEEWKRTVGVERSKKISETVKKLQSNPEWIATKGKQRIESLSKTLNDPVWKATVGAAANQKRSISVSKAKSSPEWKAKNSTLCALCNKAYSNNVLSRHIVKCTKDKENLS